MTFEAGDHVAEVTGCTADQIVAAHRDAAWTAATPSGAPLARRPEGQSALFDPIAFTRLAQA